MFYKARQHLENEKPGVQENIKKIDSIYSRAGRITITASHQSQRDIMLTNADATEWEGNTFDATNYINSKLRGPEYSKLRIWFLLLRDIMCLTPRGPPTELKRLRRPSVKSTLRYLARAHALLTNHLTGGIYPYDAAAAAAYYYRPHFPRGASFIVSSLHCTSFDIFLFILGHRLY